MTRTLPTELKALKSAVNNLNDETATNVLETLTDLLKLVKPNDALNTDQADKLTSFFNQGINELYKPLPEATIKFVAFYFTILIRQFKSHELWQYVGGRGILTGLVLYMQEDDVDVVTHFEKNFITSLCQLLKGDGLRNGSKLNPDFRRSIGAFLAEVISKNQQVRKWMLEAKLLGINGLSNLILNETEFRVLDTCLEIATRLAPKRSDPQARRAFFADIFNSTSAKLQFGERTCKFLMKIMEQPQKGSTWFEISDQIFAEMDGNSDRLHRFVMQHLVICGKVFSEKDTSLRLYLDTGITFNGFQRDAAEEVMITTSYDSLIKVQIDYPGEFSSARLVLSSPPVWENPNETTFHKASLVVILHLPTTEMARFQSALKQHGQASKIFDSAKPPKQSFSSHPTQLGRSDPPSPPALEEKAEIMKSFIESSPPLSSRKSVPAVQEPANKGKIPSSATSKAPAISKNDHPKPISKPQVTHQLITLEKEEKSVRQSDAHVRRGVIVDSEDEDETNKEHPKPQQEVPSLRKRKSSELTDLDGALSPPARKKIRVEKDTYREAPKNAKHQPTKDLRQPLARDISAQINTVPKGGNSVGATATKIFAKPVPPQRVPRLNQMKTRDGTRPTAVSTPRRRRQMAKTEIPRSMQAPSQSFAGNPERPSVNKKAVRSTGEPKQAKSGPQKAIWEAEDFSQKAALVFPPLDHRNQEDSASGELPVENVIQGEHLEMDPQNDESLEPEGGSVGTSSREDAVVEGSIEEEDASGGEVASDEDDVVEEHVEENFPIPANLNMEEAAFRGNHASSSFHSNMVEDAGPSPEGLNQKIEPFIQEVNPPSPIQPTMILRRKLRDADTFRQRLLQMPVLTGTTPIPGKDIPPTEFSQEKGGSLVQSQVSTRLQISASTNQPGVSSPHAVSGSSHTFKKDLFNELEDQVGPSRPPLNIKNTGWQKGPEKQKAVQNLKNATKAVDKKKPPRHRPPPPVTTDDESDSETDQSRSPTPPKSELDEIADVLTSIQDTILNKINGKFSGVRREARLARTHLLENAVVDLEVMQENHEKSLARFMKLEEKCGEVTQQIIGDLAELQVANDAIVNNLRGIIQEHDEVTAATKAARKPLFPKLPACLEK